ncbi:MAG: alpha-amylase [Bacteroidales bacterium]|nr:MAG: alpha-amylase [Bacteroidales bacterium]
MKKAYSLLISYVIFFSAICLLAILISCKDEEDGIHLPDFNGSNDTLQDDTPFADVPNTSDIIMYEINERAFSASGDFAGITDRLDSISSLGVNVIWLMPVHPIGEINSVNSPYCVKDYKDINPEYGDLGDLRALVREAHNQGMAVILDWVANHTSWDNDWIQNKSWYTQDAEGNIIYPAGTNYEDVADLNYDNAEMRLEMIEAMKYWIIKANIDGYRCDAADYVPYSFWSEAIEALQELPDRDIILLAEGARVDHLDAGFQMIFSWDFYNKSKNVFENGQSAKGFYQTHRNEYNNIPEGLHRLRFTSNHDECAWDDTPLGIFGGMDASIAAFVITSYMGGVPLIYNGQEVGCPDKLPFFSNLPIDWSINPDMFHEYKMILGIRNSNIALRSGALEDFSSDDIVAFTRKSPDNEVLVLVNTRNETIIFEFPLNIQNTTWQYAINDTSVTLNSAIVLYAFDYHIFKK